MSIRNLTQPNNLDIFARTLNGLSIEPLKVLNNNGDVLTVVNKSTGLVEFQAPASGVPDTVGFPDGYVLKIIDNTTNEVNWESDSVGGAVVPFVLTGDDVNALQVRNTLLEASLTVDTTTSTVQLQGITRVEGVDDLKKFGVYNDADSITPEFCVDTQNHQVKIGSIDSTEKFNIKDGGGNNVFNVDSINHACDIINNAGNKYISMTTQGINGPELVIDSSSATDAFSRVQVKNSSIDGGIINLTAFPTGNGTQISCNGPLTMNSYQVAITGETLIRTSNPKENHFVCKDVGGAEYLKVDSLNGIVKSSLITQIKGNNKKGKFTINEEITGDPIFTVSTYNGVGNVLISNGLNSEDKFVVRNQAQTNIIRIDTTNDRIESSGKLLLNGDNNNNKLLVKNNNSNDVFRVDTGTGIFYFGDSVNGSFVTQIDPNIAKQIIYGSGPIAPTLLLKNLTQTSELSLVATANTQPNKLISNKPLSIEAQGNTILTTSVGTLSLNAATSSTMTANNGNINMVVSDGAIFPQFTVRNNSTLLFIEDALTPNLNHMEFSYNRIVSKGSPLTNQAYINFNPNSNEISTSDISLNNISIINQPTLNQHGANKLYVDTHVRVLSNITSYYNEIPSGTPPSVPTPSVQVAWTQPIWTSAVFVNGTPLNFTAPSPGTVQYTGTITRWFNITISVCCETSAADQEVQLVMLDNANVVRPSTFNCFYTSTTDRSGGISCTFQRQLALNDQVKFAYRTPRAATNLTFMGYKIQITEC